MAGSLPSPTYLDSPIFATASQCSVAETSSTTGRYNYENK